MISRMMEERHVCHPTHLSISTIVTVHTCHLTHLSPYTLITLHTCHTPHTHPHTHHPPHLSHSPHPSPSTLVTLPTPITHDTCHPPHTCHHPHLSPSGHSVARVDSGSTAATCSGNFLPRKRCRPGAGLRHVPPRVQRDCWH